MAKIKVEKFLMRQGNRVGKAAVEFTEGPLAGFHLVGFTICDDDEKGMFILFPAAITPKSKDGKDGKEGNRPYFFLRPTAPDALARLENEILDVYESMDGGEFKNKPRMVGGMKAETAPTV
jgi:hypothetical protein